ncbi:hypothetical protein [Roseateles sp. DXS20W]
MQTRTARHRRWRWAAAIVLLLSATGGWRWWAAGGEPDPADAAGQAASAAAGEAGASGRALAGTAASAASGVAAAPAGAVVNLALGAETVAVPADGFTFCGARRVSVDELKRWAADRTRGRDEARRLEAQMQVAGKAGLVRASARLAMGSERQQVAARLLMRDQEGAAALAERSLDVQAYQMALSACRGMGGSGAGPACARLSIQRWAELDPTDARPWLRLMREAHLRQDAAGVAAALAEAASRPRWSRASSLLEGQLLAVADAVPDAGELGNALVQAIGFDAAMDDTWDVLVLSSRACKGEALRDANRAAHCRALAPRILAQTYDLGEARAAQALADRVGVPREQQAHDAATLQAAEAQRAQEMPDVNPTCESLQALRQFSAARVASGDLGVALAALRPGQPAR